jgi:hypothetical protein
LCAVPLCFTSTERLPLQLLPESTVAVSPALASSAQGPAGGCPTGNVSKSSQIAAPAQFALDGVDGGEHVCAIPGVRALARFRSVRHNND